MDTIVYICRSKNNNPEKWERPYVISTFSIQDYQLVRLELGGLFWDETNGEKRGFLQAFLDRRWERRRKQRTTEKLKEDLAALLDAYGENYRTGGSSLSGKIRVQDIVPLPEFDYYLDRDWVKRLLPYAVHPHFIVLGNVPYLPELLCVLARRMKSLLWILPDHYYAEMLEDFVEDFYQEFGLAIDLRFLEADETYGHVCLSERQLREPVNVLDFTEGKCVPRCALGGGSPDTASSDIANSSVDCGIHSLGTVISDSRRHAGSPEIIWLDMAAVEEKEKKLLARRLNILYLSLKTQWAQPQKVQSIESIYKT